MSRISMVSTKGKIRMNRTIGKKGRDFMNKKTQGKRDHIFVKELQWASEKILKHEKFTYVSVFGPKRKDVNERKN